MNILGISAYYHDSAACLVQDGKIHTPKAGNDEIDVPLVQMNALMGLISDQLVQAVMESPLSAEDRLETLRAFNKLLWIQNDLINRHYQGAC